MSLEERLFPSDREQMTKWHGGFVRGNVLLLITEAADYMDADERHYMILVVETRMRLRGNEILRFNQLPKKLRTIISLYLGPDRVAEVA
jgi:hypothetical protein